MLAHQLHPSRFPCGRPLRWSAASSASASEGHRCSQRFCRNPSIARAVDAPISHGPSKSDLSLPACRLRTETTDCWGAACSWGAPRTSDPANHLSLTRHRTRARGISRRIPPRPALTAPPMVFGPNVLPSASRAAMCVRPPSQRPLRCTRGAADTLRGQPARCCQAAVHPDNNGMSGAALRRGERCPGRTQSARRTRWLPEQPGHQQVCPSSPG
mmetsp:Transcript_54594/g.151457  ORF Transcript_54594/g.151457 Transcript_54594/m.151457 type:complete len:214 (+) Transcript_54594:72-713(+)